MLGCSSVSCPLFSSPQHKPGSDRIMGQTLLSSVRWQTYMTVSTSQKVKNHTFGHIMCLAHLILWLCPKKKKSLKVFVLVTVCVPEEPNVSDNKDMLCWGLCDCCAFLKQTYLEVFLLYLTSLWVKDRWIIEIGSVIHFLNWLFLATLSFTMLLWLLTLVWSRPGTKFKHNIVWSYSTCIWASEIEKHHEMVLYYHYY